MSHGIEQEPPPPTPAQGVLVEPAGDVSPLVPARLPIVLWGVAGALFLCTWAVFRLTPLALEPIAEGTLSAWQGVLYAVWVLVNLYAEGYRGFQKGFAPRVVGRALELAAAPTRLRVALAPAYCMTLFAAPRRRMIVSWSIVTVIVLLVIAMRHTPQPWRGIVDGGVVVGLVWGIAATLVLLVTRLREQAART